MDKFASVRDSLNADLQGIAALSSPIVSDDSRKAVAAKLLAISALKKWAPQGISQKAKDNALNQFRSANAQCGLREPSMVADDELLFAFKLAMEGHLGWRMEDQSYGFLETLAPKLEPGPGSSYRHNNTGSFFEKYFQGPVSVTGQRLLTYYRQAISHNESWAVAEYQRWQEFGVEFVDSSSLFYASKNAEIARVCCTEPGINMLFQKAIGRHMEERQRDDFGLVLSLQDGKNRLLASIGARDDSFVTLDLKDSSNSTSTQLVKTYVPEPLRSWMLATRSPFTTLPGGERVELKMISSMGNGFTFPLQVSIFTCIIRACCALKGIPFRRASELEWGVFGDDIICSKELCPSVIRLLFLLGYTVNVEKSFTEGPFRESCGGDYFKGSNVRGVYITSLGSDPQIYSAINRLNRWSVRNGILLKNTVQLLVSMLSSKRPYAVPRFESDDAGIHVPSVLVDDVLSYRCLTPKKLERAVEVDSPEYLGYGDALYVCVLAGYVSSRDGPVRPMVEGEERNPPPLVLSQRDVKGLTRYRAVIRSNPGDWDWPGLADASVAPSSPLVGGFILEQVPGGIKFEEDVLAPRRDDSWGAVVWLNLG